MKILISNELAVWLRIRRAIIDDRNVMMFKWFLCFFPVKLPNQLILQYSFNKDLFTYIHISYLSVKSRRKWNMKAQNFKQCCWCRTNLANSAVTRSTQMWPKSSDFNQDRRWTSQEPDEQSKPALDWIYTLFFFGFFFFFPQKKKGILGFWNLMNPLVQGVNWLAPFFFKQHLLVHLQHVPISINPPFH